MLKSDLSLPLRRNGPVDFSTLNFFMILLFS